MHTKVKFELLTLIESIQKIEVYSQEVSTK